MPIFLQAHEAGHHETSLTVTLLFAGVLLAMVLTLAFEEKIHAKKSLITGFYAVVSLLLGAAFDLLPFGPVENAFGDSLNVPVYIPAVDWGVIAIIFGSSLFVDVTAKSGLFTWIAIKLTKASAGDPLRLLIYYGIMTVVFSAVLNNVTAMIIVGSLTGVSLRKLGQDEKLLGFLLIEGLLTNIGGLLTLISSVPNIIVGQTAGISFVSFFIAASPFVIAATAATLFMGARLFRIRPLRGEEEQKAAAELVAGFDENDGIESRGFFNFAAAMTILFIILIATTSVLPWVGPTEDGRDGLGMGFVAIAFGVIMLLRFKSSVDKFYRALDWDLLLFFVFLFVVINVMEHAQVLTLIGQGLEAMIGLGPMAGTAATLVSAAGFSAVTDNIPLAAMLAKILAGLETPGDSGLWWAVIFGANLGGNLTPIGSASTVVAVTIMHKQGVPMSFAGFVKAALPYAGMQILLAVLYVLFVLPLIHEL
ncbi:MAG: SLC13 family permease [Myxococcota bacterium]